MAAGRTRLGGNLGRIPVRGILFLFAQASLLLFCSPTLRALSPDEIGAAKNPPIVSSLPLTPEERAWLQQHPDIRVGVDPEWPPFSYHDGGDNALVGLDLDFLKIVQERLGVRFTIVTGKNWSEVYGKVQSRDVDMLSAVALTPEREGMLNFTEPYIDFPVAIITRNNAPFMIGFPQLEGHQVAVPRDYAPTLLLQRDYPHVQLVMTDTTGDAFRLVSSGHAFATLDNLASASYLIKDRGLTNLKVAGITNYGFALRYGVRKDWPILPGILHKALVSISAREREVLKDRWIDLGVDEMIDSRRYGRVLLTCLSVVGLSVLLVLIWNWTLAREVGRRKAAELELREARNRAVDASQMKSAFLANLSHEIRNPLDAMLGFTELLKQENDARKSRRYIEAIDAGGRTLLGVINDVLDLSKVEAGKVTIHLAPVDLRLVVSETHALFAQRAAQKGIEFTEEVESTIPPYLLFDELRLRQILYNSVGNAIKFTERGSVRIWAAFEAADDKGSKGELSLKVIDTGVGIPPEEQKRIFEPFVQREGQSPLLGGTGLGLTIAKRLTELMGGRIEIESQPGWGATFRFLFPNIQAAAAPERPTSGKSLSLADFECLDVLVVDDQEANRELLKEYFQRDGHNVREAGDGEQCLSLARSHCPHLIVLDFRLPGLNGVEVARKLMDDPAMAGVRIIFLSGSTGDAHDIPALAHAVSLSKPMAYAELIAALRRLLPDKFKKKKAAA